MDEKIVAILFELQDRIKLNSNYLECLRIREYYLEHRNTENEYEENENNLKLIHTRIKIEKLNAILTFLFREFDANFEIYNELLNETERNNDITANAQ